MAEHTLRLGVDTGGTFTDLVALVNGTIITRKVPSTPHDPSQAIMAGVADVVDAAARPRQGPEQIVHGSTVATNAVLENRGAAVALITTAGFEDVIRIGRQTRPRLYDVFVPVPPSLVDPARVFGVRERLDADGTVLVPLGEDDLTAVVARVAASGAEVVAVCLLHSYANPRHEQQIAQRLREAGVLVCASSEILPEYREFERWSTTVVNAAVTPIMQRYLSRLEDTLGRSTRLSVMQSNGGVVSAATARAQAIRTILSGPAGGVIGARAAAATAGFDRIITFDMGGTSTDVSVVDGAIATTAESTIGPFPVRVPMIDIHTIGAGGGSIAWIDEGSAMRVGPQSAGAVPGPACYGHSDAFTVTDANLLLGRLDADRFLGGRLPLDRRRAEAAAQRLAQRAEMDLDALSEGVVRVANTGMERAIRSVTIERGLDPRTFTLCAFGGAGGMHACDLAASLAISTVLVPRNAGVLSALGMVYADVRRDYVASVLGRGGPAHPGRLARRFLPLERQATVDLRQEGVPPADRLITRSVDVRYAGQSYELTVPFTAHFVSAFHEAHERAYGYAARSRPVEVVNVRVTGIGRLRPPPRPRARRLSRGVPKRLGSRAGRFGGRTVRVSFYDWAALEPGMTLDGPAVMTGRDATAVLPPHWSARIDAWGNIVCVNRGQRGTMKT